MMADMAKGFNHQNFLTIFLIKARQTSQPIFYHMRYVFKVMRETGMSTSIKHPKSGFVESSLGLDTSLTGLTCIHIHKLNK